MFVKGLILGVPQFETHPVVWAVSLLFDISCTVRRPQALSSGCARSPAAFGSNVPFVFLGGGMVV